MTRPVEPWLALDVGGANIKAAHTSGTVASAPFELWRRPADLAGEVARVASSFPPFAAVALTMTAELCDCYPTKRDGVTAVLDAVEAGLPGVPVAVWGTDARLRPPAAVRSDPLPAAAANWLALAVASARLAGPGPGLLVDVGSTTTDLIPLAGGRPDARGRTDTNRLREGELVYAGVRRTPVFALADRVPFRGRATGVAAELFATTLDVFLTLGNVPEDPDDRATADGRPATRDAARGRLARVIGADREGFTAGDALQLSVSMREKLLARLASAVETTGRTGAGRPSTVVVCGSGEFLARQLASRVVAPGGKILSLTDTWGPGASVAACAKALLAIATEAGAACVGR